MTSDWVTTRIADVCVDNGIITGPFGSLLHAEDYVDIGTPLITVKNIKNNFIDSTKIDFVSEEDTNRLKRYTLELDDIVFSRVGNVDQRCLATPEIVGWMISGSCLRLRVDKTKIDPEFLCWLMGHPSFTYLMTSYSVGSTRPSLNTGILSNFEISFPRNLVEQKQLAEPLTNLHNLIKTNVSISANLANQIVALFRSWFIDFDPVKAKAVGKLPYSMSEGTAALFPDSFENSKLGPIPAGWKIGTMSELCEKNNKMKDGPFGSNLKSSDFTESGVRLIHQENIDPYNFNNSIKRYTSQKKADELSTHTALPGDIVLTKMPHPICRATVVPSVEPLFVILADVIRIRPDELIPTNFLLFLINSVPFQTQAESWSVGGTRARITLSVFRKLPCIIPPLELMNKFDDLVSTLFEKMEQAKIQNERLIELRDALLPRLMSGELSAPEAA